MNPRHEAALEGRQLPTVQLKSDLVIVGGGLAGTCCAITAARAGMKVVLAQDRPVLGGNGSSEVRLWILGATSHMGNNNRWAREGGVVDEILVENLYRNPEGNSLIVDTILLEKVHEEPNITLLLNTAVHELEKSGPDHIRSVRAFCSQNSTSYEISAPLFCDASGDGILGFLAGAAFRMGAEASSEFGEKMAPSEAVHELLGHTIYFYSRDTGKPVKFVPPSFAIRDVSQIPRWRDFTAADSGCKLWWLEWGGRLDTVRESERIKWELWRVAYGVWNFIKNSGRFPEAETLTLEWVGTIPGKRESRRFEGDYILRQQDIIEQRAHDDAVAFGGWAIDLHPADGVFSEKPGCSQWHSKGVYQIPYRCYYSQNISNLFLAGRIISASHVAFGSSRVMATCAHGAQAVAIAASLCNRDGLQPRDLLEPARMKELQQSLLGCGQYIPRLSLNDSKDLARQAKISVSSEMKLAEMQPSGGTLQLSQSWAMMLPVTGGNMPRVSIRVDANAPTELQAQLRMSASPYNHTPEIILARKDYTLTATTNQEVEIVFDTVIDEPRYVFLCLMHNDNVFAHVSDRRVTGMLSLCHNRNKAVAKSPTQTPPSEIGVDSFEFWTPMRRPGGHNFAMTIDPPLSVFGAENLVNGIGRPTNQPNAWVAAWQDTSPVLKLLWAEPKAIGRIELVFDPDFDHPMESVLFGHPERVAPFCLQQFQIRDGAGGVLFKCQNNHQSRRTVILDAAVTTDQISIVLTAPSEFVPAALFEVRCYER